MTTPAETNTRAWQALTPRGVAAFARAPLMRLLVVQWVVSALAAATVVWFLRANCFPVIGEAIGQLPAQGEIVGGKLNWPEGSPQLLAGGNFLSFAVDLNHEGGARSPAQIEIEFGRGDVRLFSLFGYAGFEYPKEWIIAFNRPELEPRWGAWVPPILWITAGAIMLGLMVIWGLLATLYLPAVWLAGFYANRDLNLRAGWKLAGAALMPGALLMTAGIGLYGLGAFDLVKFLAVGVAHIIVTWAYLFAAAFYTPKTPLSGPAAKNPFATPADDKAEGGPR